MKKSNIIITAAAVVLTCSIAAVTIYAATVNPISPATNENVNNSAVSENVNPVSEGIGEEKALEIAQADVKTFTDAEQTVVKNKLDYDDGAAEYDIDIVADNTKYDYEIDASTGNINERDIESVKKTGKEISKTETFDESLYIGEEAAKTAALEFAKVDAVSAVFTEIKLDRDDGSVVYEIEFYVNQIEYEAEIDALTGTVTEFEIDD